MNFCAIICEFNPFHNGHKYILEQARRLSGCDGVLCIMSGSFTQRGEACVFDKYTRARHAVLSGADCVIQLPAPFAVAPAEIFASGAIKILSAIPQVKKLAFGCEDGDKQLFINSAELLIEESEKFKTTLYGGLDSGESYVKSYAEAFKQCGGDGDFIEKPNNILGIEYTKAVLRAAADIEIMPVKRVGSFFNEKNLQENFSSAQAIRLNPHSPTVKDNMPAYVYEDFKNYKQNQRYGNFLTDCLFKANTRNLKRIYGCNEGLENRLKNIVSYGYEKLLNEATTKRYSASRIRRILCANALELYADDCRKFMDSPLYIRPLAVKKDNADSVLSALSQSRYPLVTAPHTDKLSGAALECFEKDKLEFSTANYLAGTTVNDYMITV